MILDFLHDVLRNMQLCKAARDSLGVASREVGRVVFMLCQSSAVTVPGV